MGSTGYLDGDHTLLQEPPTRPRVIELTLHIGWVAEQGLIVGLRAVDCMHSKGLSDLTMVTGL